MNAISSTVYPYRLITLLFKKETAIYGVLCNGGRNALAVYQKTNEENHLNYPPVLLLTFSPKKEKYLDMAAD